MQGLRIRYVLDSHGHNNYLSGLSEVAGRAEVQLLGSAEADLGYDHRPLRDGEQLELGEVGIEVLGTPGHTPEHISLLIYDRSGSAEAVSSSLLARSRNLEILNVLGAMSAWKAAGYPTTKEEQS